MFLILKSLFTWRQETEEDVMVWLRNVSHWLRDLSIGLQLETPFVKIMAALLNECYWGCVLRVPSFSVLPVLFQFILSASCTWLEIHSQTSAPIASCYSFLYLRLIMDVSSKVHINSSFSSSSFLFLFSFFFWNTVKVNCFINLFLCFTSLSQTPSFYSSQSHHPIPLPPFPLPFLLRKG